MLTITYILHYKIAAVLFASLANMLITYDKHLTPQPLGVGSSGMGLGLTLCGTPQVYGSNP